MTFMQNALLLHMLQSEEDQGLVLVKCNISGDLDRELMKRAWEKVIQRHAVMRTSIHWEDIQKGVQVIHPTANLPLKFHDWREMPEEEFDRSFLHFQQQERSKGLPMNKAPISRVFLFQQSDTEYRLLWTCHHILLDGWSASIIFQDLFAYYDGLVRKQGISLPPLPSYQSYLQWQKTHKNKEEAAFWKQKLAGFVQPTLVQEESGNRREKSDQFIEHYLSFSEQDTSSFRQLPHQMGISFNILMQAVWGIVLARLFGKQDVMYGLTVSGRSGPFPGLELMADQFINVLPVRHRIEHSTSFSNWLKSLQGEQLVLNRFESTGINEIQSWIDWPGHIPMFDSLLVFQSLPWEQLQRGNLILSGLEGGTTSIYPLTVMIKQGSTLTCSFRYNQRLVSKSKVLWMANQMKRCLINLCKHPSQLIGDLVDDLSEAPYLSVNGTSPSEKATATTSFTPPQYKYEAHLFAIWKEILGKESFGVTDDFFEIGGTSLLAVQMFAKITSLLGVQLPPISLLEHPNIRALASLLADGQASHVKWSSLVPIQPKGTRPPFFAIHGVGGNIFTYRELAKRLGEDQPFYGLQARGALTNQAPLDDMAELAEHYISEIQNLFPKGPYLLGGNSFGGLLAFEMAKQLKAQGFEVPILAMFDTFSNPKSNSFLARRMPTRYRLLERIDLHLGHLLMIGYRKKFFYSIEKLKERFQKRFHKNEKELYPGQSLTGDVFVANYKAANAYQLEPYDGKITLFMADQVFLRFFQDPRLGWHKFAKGGLEVHIVSGDHNSMMQEPQVQTLAELLTTCIDRVDV